MAAAPRPPPGPLINESIFDVPSQRLYIAGLALFFQASKIIAFVRLLSGERNDAHSSTLLFQWMLLDAVFIWAIPLLRIPRLQFNRRASLAQILIIILFDWALFGNYVFTWGKFLPLPLQSLFGMFEYDELSISQKRVRVQDVVDYGAHLLGQHTVRLSPISTAKLNPQATSFCLALPQMAVFIPILLNNTRLNYIQYSLAPLGDKGPRAYINVTSRDLNKMQTSASSLIISPTSSSRDILEDEDDEDDDAPGLRQIAHPSTSKRLSGGLEKTQSISYLKINRPGVIRLERALDASNAVIRLYRTETTVVECPSVKFEADTMSGTQCLGVTQNVHINVRGTVPMSLTWHRDIRGKREQFVVEGIEGPIEADRLPFAQDVRIPLSLPLDTPGPHTYTLDSLVDGVGNTVDLASGSSKRSDYVRSVEVFGRSSVSFRGCSGSSTPVSLLKGQASRLHVALNEVDSSDGPWIIKIKFQPSSGSSSGWTKDYTLEKGKKNFNVMATEAGDYSIVDIHGRSCPGDILNPETCRVVEQPVPSAEIEFKNIHECSGDTGVSAIALLHGTPPFVLYYATKHDRQAPVTSAKTFNTARAEITLQPDKSGRYTYTFTHLTDSNYQKVELDGPSTTQVVHPLASASFVAAPGSTSPEPIVSDCDGKYARVQLRLRGTPPFTVEMQIVGSRDSETFRASNIETLFKTIEVPVPPDVESGRTFNVDLVSVEDASGCKRPLSVRSATVLVKRIKPTVKFYAADGKREVTILENETARLPLRLTGDGPWSLVYKVYPGMVADPWAEIAQTEFIDIRSANDHLVVKQKGLYELYDVTDLHCSGDVVPEASTYIVDWVPKPTGIFDVRSGTLASNASIIRAAVCEGVEDHVDLELKGRPPFQVAYTYARDRERSRDQVTFNSIQPITRLQLRTSEPGHHEYHLAHIGDAAYPLPHLRERYSNLPQLSGTVLEQQVIARPSARFKSIARASYCLNDRFVPRTSASDEGTIALHGQPPFLLEISVKNLASSETRLEKIEVTSHEWKVQFSDYEFTTVGPYMVTIESVTDSTPCSQATTDSNRQSFFVDVAETAAIVPYDRHEDFCVGDVLHFQLEGNAPWRVDYRFNNKVTSAVAKTPKFSRIAESPGVFEIVSVAHQQALCQTTVSDIHINIRDIPSARVSHGDNVIEDIREGDQAEILFSLEGTPPFTFTYQRASLAPGKKGSKVLETHTVSNVMTKEYSVFSALEGIWTVTFISDKYCRYPPASSTPKIEAA